MLDNWGSLWALKNTKNANKDLKFSKEAQAKMEQNGMNEAKKIIYKIGLKQLKGVSNDSSN